MAQNIQVSNIVFVIIALHISNAAATSHWNTLGSNGQSLMVYGCLLVIIAILGFFYLLRQKKKRAAKALEEKTKGEMAEP
jgi:hypothetical protein